MAWRPYENLIDGELSNRVPGKVTGWMRFVRKRRQPLKVTFDLEGDFHEDIRGTDIVLSNAHPSDKNASLGQEGTYMEGFDPVQRGNAGDITAGLSLGPWTQELADRLRQQLEILWQENGITGEELEGRRREVAQYHAANIAEGKLYYAHAPYPYIEWFSDNNGRVVLELDPDQIRVIRNGTPPPEKTPEELAHDRKRRTTAFGGFMRGMVESFRRGKKGKVTGIVVG